MPRARSIRFYLGIAVGLAAFSVPVSSALAGAAPSRTLSGIHVFSSPSYKFSDPVDLVWTPARVWVANGGIATNVTGLSSSTGAFAASLSGANYNFGSETAIATCGSDELVANYTTSSVTEFNAASGAFVRNLSDSSFDFNYPHGIAVLNGNAYVADWSSNTVTEIKCATGALVKVIKGGSLRFSQPECITSNGSDLFVLNYHNGAGESVTEFSPNGTFVRYVAGPAYKFKVPASIAANASDVWVSNSAGNSITEFKVTGALVRVINAPSLKLKGPEGLALAGAKLWVANFGGSSVESLNVATGTLAHDYVGAAYKFKGPIDVVLSAGGAQAWVTDAIGNSVTEFTTT